MQIRVEWMVMFKDKTSPGGSLDRDERAAIQDTPPKLEIYLALERNRYSALPRVGGG